MTMEEMEKNDSLEAIYALNIGDFLVDSFISEDLLDKISVRVADDPENFYRHLEELIDIYALDKTLGILGFESDDSFVLYDSVASTLANIFQVDACHIFQTATNDMAQEYLSLSGTSINLEGHHRWKIGVEIQDTDLLGRSYLNQSTTVVTDVQKQPMWSAIEALKQEQTHSMLISPLVNTGKGMGLLVFETYQDYQFSSELLDLSEATAKAFVSSISLQQWISKARQETSKAIPNNAEMQNLRAAITECIAELGIQQQAFVETLGEAIDARQAFTRGHSKRVAETAKTLANTMALNEKTIDLVYTAGLVGHIGKMAVPDQVLNKQEKLDNAEWEQFHTHPNVGVNLLAQINFLSEIVPYVTYQQERWDGSGKPDGRTGQNIPLGSRLLAVADAYQALVEERPYRDKAFTHAEAVDMLQKEAGAKWDPELVALLAKLPESAFK